MTNATRCPAKTQRPSCRATALRSLGIFRPQWLADYYRLRQPSLPGLLAAWQEEGLVVPVNVEALGEMWLHRDALAQLESAPGGKLIASHSAVLFLLTRWSGIGNARSNSSTSAIAWSAISPAPKRQYGYFVLPLLHQGKLVGRMDSKIHRKARSWRSSPCGWRRV